jgi:hypothetical protein
MWPPLPKHLVRAHGLKTTSLDTISLPIFDDFSYKSTMPTSAFWSDNKVFINSTIATGLKSIGTATFDGLDEYGFPYNINTNLSDTITDVLTSQFINFGSDTNNLFLTFMYQRGGLGEAPEPQDSLTVQFWSPQDSAWSQVWGVKGIGISTDFKFASVEVSDPKFKLPGFRFRFAAYGAPNGAFDVWNIDYVELDSDRSASDTTVQEPAFIKNHPFITKNFTQLPWFHFNTPVLQDSITIVYRRNGTPPPGGWALNLGKYFILKDGVQIKDRLTVPVITNLNHNVDINFRIPLQPLSLGAISGEFNIFMRTWFDGTAEGVRSNDTIEIDIPFRNYYATDDGSAERAYGVLNQTNARVAFLFQPLQPDTLRGFFINFAHSGVDVTLNSFRLCVWANSNGEPGNPIYISDSLYKPKYGFYHNDFIPYDLEKGVYIPGDVFVGFIQASTAGLYVGLDINTPQENKFYGNGFFWFNSLATGTLMIRPYFRYTPLNFSVEESEVQKQIFSVYPNPAQNEININSHDSKIFWMLFNQLGIAVMSGQEQSINTAQLPRGAYFLKIESEQRVENHKIILQ